MHIVVAPVGGIEEAYPFIGLAARLKSRGHQATVAASSRFEGVTRGAGVDFIATHSEEVPPQSSHPPSSFAYLFETAIAPAMRGQYRVIRELQGIGKTLVVGSHMSWGARIAQETTGARMATVHCQPSNLWSGYQPRKTPSLLGRLFAPHWFKANGNRHNGERSIREQILNAVNTFRAENELPGILEFKKWRYSKQANICMFPKWYGEPQSDSPANVTMTHFPIWDDQRIKDAPHKVLDFLQGGSAPIVFAPDESHGSPQSFFRSATEVCDRLNRRGILVSRAPGGAPENLPESIAHFRHAPLDQLLPLAAAVVHSGGPRTTAHALAAGTPQLVIPINHEHPDNAIRVKWLGVGEAVSSNMYKPKDITHKLRQLLDSAYVKNACMEVRRRFRGVDGLKDTAMAIEKLALGAPVQHSPALTT